MKRKDVSQWESQWMSPRRREEIATERMELEKQRHTNGWRRNYLSFASAAVIALLIAALLQAGK